MRHVLPLLILTLCLALAACSGDEPPPDNGAQDQAASDQAPATRTPQAIGQDIRAAHAQAMAQLADLLGREQDPDQLLPQVRQLHEATARNLVALGRERQNLDTFGKADCDRVIQQGMTSIPPETYAALDQAVQRYAANPDLAEALAGFNDIVQYAILELLREQRPAEATRLGAG